MKAKAYEELTHLFMKTKNWSFKIATEHSGALPETKKVTVWKVTV